MEGLEDAKMFVFIALINLFQVEVSGSDATSTEDDPMGARRNLSLAGVAITTVHNPYFSAFAKYEAGRSGNFTPDTKIPASMRRQQTLAAEYKCVNADKVYNSYLYFDLLEVRWNEFCS